MLTSRQTELLKTLVHQYIESASPVASDSVVRKHALGVSSATVRNDMADLEDQGYITRPYHSAGAVPSSRGYRFYVEAIDEPAELPPASQRTLRMQFTRAEQDLDGWTRLAASLLSGLVNNVALVTIPRERESHVVRIDLVPVQETLVFLVLVLQEVKLRKQLLTLDEPLSGDDLQVAANRLNDVLGGRSRRQILSQTSPMSHMERTVTGRVVDMMEAEDNALYSDHHMEGLARLLGQPEFAQAGKVHGIVEALEDRELPRMVMAETPEGGRMRVVIGEENRADTLHPLSMVVCRYGGAGGGAGTISAIGPTRMEYPRAIACVRFISALLSDTLARVRG